MDQATETNDTIQELQKIFKPRQRDSAESTMVQGTATRVNIRLPSINENEIGTILQKHYNNAIRNGRAWILGEDVDNTRANSTNIQCYRAKIF